MNPLHKIMLWYQLLQSDGPLIDEKAKKFLKLLKYPIDAVKEIAQNVLIKLSKTTKPVPPTWPRRNAYIWVTCLSCAADWLQNKRSERDKKTKLGLVSPPSETPLDVFLKKERSLAIQRALDTLDPLNRKVIELRYFDFLTVPEIAAILHLSKGAVEQRLYRSLRKLSRQKCLIPFAPPSLSRSR